MIIMVVVADGNDGALIIAVMIVMHDLVVMFPNSFVLVHNCMIMMIRIVVITGDSFPCSRRQVLHRHVGTLTLAHLCENSLEGRVEGVDCAWCNNDHIDDQNRPETVGTGTKKWERRTWRDFR